MKNVQDFAKKNVSVAQSTASWQSWQSKKPEAKSSTVIIDHAIPTIDKYIVENVNEDANRVIIENPTKVEKTALQTLNQNNTTTQQKNVYKIPRWEYHLNM